MSPISREQLTAQAPRVLHRGGPGNPDVLLATDDRGAPCVVKDFAPRGRLIRRLAPWLVRRELRAYRQLEGHASVPRLLGELDALAFALEYRPGRILGPQLEADVPASFGDELARAVDAMHARGVVHLDLRHRGNALLGEDGRPVLVDFASALCFRPGGLAARVLLPALAWIDRRAVRKWRRQLAGRR